jgi:hypothetical protein
MNRDILTRYLEITYLIIFVAVSALDWHAVWRGPMSPMEKILVAPILWGLAAHGICHGSALGRWSQIDRSQRPYSFWTIVIFELLFGLFLFCWGVREVLA